MTRASMRASAVARAGTWPGEHAVDRVVLDFNHRCRRRIALTTEGGRAVVLDLPHATVIGDGDALRLDDGGGFIAVAAADEPLVEITCGSAHALARIAWHLGNRHLPVQIVGAAIRIRRDHVIEAMLTGLGASTAPIDAPFDPEGGAYGQGHAHGHGHGH